MNTDNNKDQKATTGRDQQNQQLERPDQKPKEQNEQLTKEELPDSTNESHGNTGSGQRQDSN